MRLRRWFVKRFRTTIRPGRYNKYGGRILTTDEWDAIGGWDGALAWGWQVERPDWWERGCRTAVTAATVEEATLSLDEWQDAMAQKHHGFRGRRLIG